MNTFTYGELTEIAKRALYLTTKNKIGAVWVENDMKLQALLKKPIKNERWLYIYQEDDGFMYVTDCSFYEFFKRFDDQKRIAKALIIINRYEEDNFYAEIYPIYSESFLNSALKELSEIIELVKSL